MARASKTGGRSKAGGGSKAGGKPPPDEKAPVTAEFQATKGADAGLPSDATALEDTGQSTISVGNRVFRVQTSKSRKLPVLPDMPDIRDRIYRPHMRALHPAIYPRIAFRVQNQEDDSSCTGFALAHVIDFLRFREIGPDSPKAVSARMLYEMAKRNDEWTGSAYEGSSLRGAIKGFFRNGVCSVDTSPDKPGMKNWALTYNMAKEARDIRLGAYFRLEPDISDYHAAINEVGAIYVSAQIHSHWDNPTDGWFIKSGGKTSGGHAFAIVGYDSEGFWILNSWGPNWGRGGVAHWRYEDWSATVMDAWVLQLGVRAPSAFGATPGATPSSASGLIFGGDPHRADIVGHFVNIDDGRLVTDGKYGSPNNEEMKETVKRLTMSESNSEKGYDHLVIYAHGGLNALTDEARRIATWKRHDIFGRNRLYNFHLMWGSGFLDEVFGKLSASPVAGRVGGKFFDWMFEAGFGKEIGGYAWRNMKQDARAAFDDIPGYGGGFKGLAPLFEGLDKAEIRPKVHLVGHSAGSIVIGHLLSAWKHFKVDNIDIGSVHLMAPACTVDFFKQHFGSPHAAKIRGGIHLYNLTDTLELADKVSAGSFPLPSYSRSLLYLVSRAYEDIPNTALAGMQLYEKAMPNGKKISIDYSKAGGKTSSVSHGGFDNDVATMTTIMSRILGKAAPKPPVASELIGY